MNHIGTQTIETNRLILRRITLDDAHDMFTQWTNDPEVTRYLTWQPHASIDATRLIIEQWLKELESEKTYKWCMQHKETNRVIGTIDIVASNERNQCGVIGYCLSRAYWNQGLMSEALWHMMDYLFNQVGFHRLEATHLSENPASGKVMIKCGMTHEGVQRKKFMGNDGLFHDLDFYGILDNEFNSLKDAL